MNFHEYQVAAMRTAKVAEDTILAGLIHASLGLATETGEYTTCVKRIARYGKPLDEAMHRHMLEELGDTLWYIALACETLGTSMRSVAAMNIEKLKLRFPETYSNDAAEGRADKGGLDARES
jgi:NTP pyrophosphatase (non-canonical NTP hydrolase)